MTVPILLMGNVSDSELLSIFAGISGMPELGPGDPENNENKITSILGSISQREKKRVKPASVVLH